MTTALDTFRTFLSQRERAAHAYVNGTAKPLDEVASHKGEATFFAPRGGYVTGAEAVWARYEKDAGSFEQGGGSHFEILDIAASGDLAWWVGLQHASARLKGKPEAVPMKLRITELFRREGDTWKLVHRHADSLAEEPAK